MRARIGNKAAPAPCNTPSLRSEYGVAPPVAKIETQDGKLKCPRCQSLQTDYGLTSGEAAGFGQPSTLQCACVPCGCKWQFCSSITQEPWAQEA